MSSRKREGMLCHQTEIPPEAGLSVLITLPALDCGVQFLKHFTCSDIHPGCISI